MWKSDNMITKMIVYTALSIFITNVKVEGRPEHSCPDDQYYACLTPVIDKVTVTNNAFPYFNDQQLDSLCGACTGLTECFQRLDMRHCDHLRLSYIEGVQKTCNSFCTEGRAYKKHRSCFNNTELQAEGSRCNYTFVDKETSLVTTDGNRISTPTQEDRVLWCQYVSDFINCMTQAVTHHCSAKVGEWIMNINMQYYHPIMERMDCRVGSKVGVAVIFGVAVGLFVTMMAVIVTSVVCRRKQRQSRALGNHHNTLSSTCHEKKSSNKSQNGKDSNGEITEYNKKSTIHLRQYYPEGESLLSSEALSNQISPNEVSTRNTEILSSVDQESEVMIANGEESQTSSKKQLLVSDL